MSQVNTHVHTTCPGSRTMDFSDATVDAETLEGTRPSQLCQWPVQLHLVGPMAPYFQNADVLLAADCVAYTLGDFHKDHLAGNSLAIACPKLDSGQDIYRQKITALVDEAKINTLTVMTMQVPCCAGLLHLAKSAVEQASRKIPIKSKVVSVRGEILSEEWC
ncbi:MAG: 4Fe-4S ferredoxin [Chloroflexi bacterium]|nr:4Fe-4S ferredoxin [Chloroflexota bacterium]